MAQNGCAATGGHRAPLHYRFDFDLLLRYVLRFPRVQYSDSTMAWFRLHADSKTQSHSPQFGIERQRVLHNLMDDRTASAVRRDAREALEVLYWREEVRRLQNVEGSSGPKRFAAIVRAAQQTPHAWRLRATYDSLGRGLRAPRSAHKALAVSAWRLHVRAMRNDTSRSRWDSVRPIVHATRRTPGA